MSSILVVDDKDSVRRMLADALIAKGHDVEVARNGHSAIEKSKESRFDLVLTDLKLPEMDGMQVLAAVKENDPETTVIVMTAFGTIETAVEAMKKGAYDFLTKPFDTEHLGVLIDRALENRRLLAENSLLRKELADKIGYSRIIGTSPSMLVVEKLIKKVASSETTVLFLGESGTGKELFAAGVHYLSSRSEKPYITINCAAIPRELLENELFGSEQGAFTSSHKLKLGKFEIADGGTVFLDEIGDLDMALQAKLLRFIQEKTFERLGGNKQISVNVRVIAATNVDLKDAIAKKHFREDLYYRLSVFPIQVPPLRERREDVPKLADYFVTKYCNEMNKPVKKLSQESVRLMDRYHWPGNVRELENTIERAVILCEGRFVNPEHLAIRVRSDDEIRLREGAGLKEIGQHAQTHAERAAILRVLAETRGNKRKTAEILQIDYTTLFEKLKRYDIEYGRN
ncbi:MAG: sigma-54-dependent Fis family transcriptional regulator [candidate division Zixibacteria bacterium]|nr:sigma-54-dependent Fis family transcriptional regulator [candidate division Zixibacteria bacterium]